MPNYENVFIARQDITSAQVDALVDQFEKVITDGDGTVPKKENWGLKTLAYKIKKNRKGHYTLLNISAPADVVHEMERQMRINEDVLRYMTICVDQLEEEPSAMMRNREREDRPRRNRDEREPFRKEQFKEQDQVPSIEAATETDEQFGENKT